jgi:hypothetical protein
MYDSSWRSLPTSWSSASEPTFSASRGSKLYAEYVVENNGAATQSVTTTLYICPTTVVSTACTAVGSDTDAIAYGEVFTGYDDFTVPTSLTRGKTYYVGAGVDVAGRLSEVFEQNNFTYLGALKID